MFIGENDVSDVIVEDEDDCCCDNVHHVSVERLDVVAGDCVVVSTDKLSDCCSESGEFGDDVGKDSLDPIGADGAKPWLASVFGFAPKLDSELGLEFTSPTDNEEKGAAIVSVIASVVASAVASAEDDIPPTGVEVVASVVGCTSEFSKEDV